MKIGRRALAVLLPALRIELAAPSVDILVHPSVCIPLDPAFTCEQPLRSVADYSDITGHSFLADVSACSCESIPPSIPSTAILDTSTLCSLSPRPLPPDACAALLPSSPVAARLEWRMSQMPQTSCKSALTDSLGPCGDPLAEQSMLQLCVLVSDPRKDVEHSAASADQSILGPFVSAADIDLLGGLDVVSNECTHETFVDSPSYACADRACEPIAPVQHVQLRCTQASPCEDSDGLSVVSFSCTRDTGVLTFDEQGCSSSLVASLCEPYTQESPACVGTPRDDRLHLEETCTPKRACGEEACLDNSGGALCQIEGTRVDGGRCVYSCPADTMYLRVQSPCTAKACGENGTASLRFIPCTSGAEEVGCLLYPDPVNSTVACTADPCPCEGALCDPQNGTEYPVLDVNGAACTSGILDVYGNCCAPSAEGEQDACGLCPDLAYAGIGAVRVGIDRAGECCSGDLTPRPVLTAGLSCCRDSDSIDVCGVCGGDGSSCYIEIQPSAVSEAVGARRVANRLSTRLGVPVEAGRDGSLLIAPGSGRFLGSLTRTYFDVTEPVHSQAEAMRRARARPSVPVRVPTDLVMRSVGVNGNGVCENDESPDVEPACSLSTRTCASFLPDRLSGVYIGDPAQACGGNGVCVRAARLCRCFYGYAGATCGTCAPGFSVFPTAGGGRACLANNLQTNVGMAGYDGSSPLGIILGSTASVVAAVIAALCARFRKRIPGLTAALWGAIAPPDSNASSNTDQACDA